MLAEERFAQILALMAEKRTATVQELCEALNASESTIRRDLNELDRLGKVNKVHGGATLPDSQFRADEPTMAAKESLAVAEKRAIANAAAALITAEDFVYLDAGSTTLALARAISGPALDAAYVTNGVAHARLLAQKGCRVCLPGGLLRPQTEAIIGAAALQSLQQYNFTKAFMGANGVALDAGFTTPDPEEAAVKAAAVRRAREAWFLVDDSKFARVYPAVITELHGGAILTNRCPNPKYKQYTLVKETEESIYTVTFNPAIDYVVRLDSPLEVGEVNRARGEDCVLGGKGINVSGVLAELGCKSVALGFVAGETGAWLERGLAAQGIQTDFIHLAQGMTRINVKIKAGQETELNGAGPNIPESAMQALEAKLDALQNGDILILAGSIPASLAQTTYERLLARLEGRGVRAVVDATRDLLVNVLPFHPFLIKPNNHELGEIVGRVLNTEDEIVAAARTLQEKGARNVLVSMAGDGALLLDERGQTHRIGCPKGKVVNSVGAGDSMVAGFVAGYLQSGDYTTALRLGTACGSATAFSLGLAKKEEIEKLLLTI